MKEIILRVNQNLLFLLLTGIVLYFGKPVLVPIMLGMLLAMLMAPVCQKLEVKGFNRASSAAVCIVILVISLSLIFWIILSQVASFMEDINQIQAKGKELLRELQIFIEAKVKIPRKEQEDIAKEQVQNGAPAAGIATSILTGFTSTLTTMVLMLVYTFLFLYNKEKFESFFVRIYHEEDTEKVKNIVGKISMVGQRYLTGRVMSILILSTLYSIALLIIGLDNAIILGGLAALLTVVPYVGTTLGGLFPFLVALTTRDSHTAFMVVIAIVAIQTIDNYFIEPNVVGGEVNLSALASIFSIIAGGAIWGVAGMILFIPMVAILKIIFDHVESLKPIGYIIGDSNGNSDRKPIFLRVKEKLFKKEESNEPPPPGQ